MTYKEKYGGWAGRPAGDKPDFKRCCEEVADYLANWPGCHQCTRKRGHGPDNAYCKQHDPDAAKRRKAASEERSNAAWNNRRYEIHGRTFFNALSKIADGHNDARGLAQAVIAQFKEDEH